MPSDYYLGYYMFAPNGRFKECGMFTIPHILASLLCIAIISVTFYKNYKKFNSTFINNGIRCTALILTILEIIKISHSFIYGDYYLDAWFPLSFCGLFIFASWIFGYGKGALKSVAHAFITYGCPVAGIAFLIFPTTSLMSYPIWHYFSLYSLFYHSVMIFWGCVFLTKYDKFNVRVWFSYSTFVAVFSVISVILNSIFSCNLMNLREPYNIPIFFLQYIFSHAPFLYTILAALVYFSIPFVVNLFMALIRCLRQKLI